MSEREDGSSDAVASPLTSLEAAMAIMRADISTGKATKRSLGVLYAFVMAGHHCSGPDFWGPINRMIIAYGEKSGAPNQFAFLEGVKKVAWSIFDTVGSVATPTKGAAPARELKSPEAKP